MKNVFFGLIILTSLYACKSTFPDETWTDKQWTLVEMEGFPVQISNSEQDAHLKFVAAEKMVAGNGACNRIFGPYLIESKNRISFSNLASTMMICPNQDFENKFLQNLRDVRYYEVFGEELWLKNTKKRVILKLR